MSKGVTLVTALYDIGKDQWKTHSGSMHSYYNWFLNTLNYVDTNFVVFTGPSSASEVQKVVNKRRKGSTRVVIQSLEDLAVYRKFYDRLEQLLQSSDFIKRRPFEVPEHMQAKYDVIMFNKTDFMRQATGIFPDTEYVGWLDAGLVRWDPESESIAWPAADLLPRNKHALFSINGSYSIHDKYNHVMSQTRFTQGGSIISPVGLLDALIRFQYETIEDCLGKAVIGSDEKITDLCVLGNRQLFEINVCDWRRYFDFYRNKQPRAAPRALIKEKRNLVLGVFCKYSVEQLRPWCESSRVCTNTAERILIRTDPRPSTPDDVETFCEQAGVQLVYRACNGTRIHHERYHVAWEFLQEVSDAFDHVLWTDVYDVFFQRDPFPAIQETLRSNMKQVIVGSEGLRVDQEPWNHDNVKRCFPHLVERCRDRDIVCSGVMAGTTRGMIDMFFLVYNLSRNVTAHEIVDQSALIALMQTELAKSCVHVTTNDEAIVVHCATSGPTQFFLPWGFKNNYKYSLPELSSDGEICVKGVPVAIVHQYVRIPEWKEALCNPRPGVATKSARTCVCVCGTSDGISLLDRFRGAFSGDAYSLIDCTRQPLPENYKGFGVDIAYTEKDARSALPCPDPALPCKGHWWNPVGNRNMIWFYPYVRMLYFFKQHPDYDFYWFFDDDFSCNDFSAFLKSFADNREDDFIAYFLFKHRSVPEGDQPGVPRENDAMYSRGWFAQDRFPGPGDILPAHCTQLFGSFFPVVRWSRRSLEHLLGVLEQGYQGYGEGFVPTVLNAAGFKLGSLFGPDNTSKYFDASKILLAHKNHRVTWSWL